MSRDWIKEDLQAVSRAMKAAGHLSYEEFCERLKEEKRMWHEGTIGVPMGDGSYKVAHYWVKSFDKGSEWGINGGKISKLMIRIDGKITANYDRGWDIEPEENTPTHFAYCILLDNYN